MRTFRNMALTFALGLGGAWFGPSAIAASTPYPMASGDYAADFTDMVNWPAGLGGASTTASNWSPVLVTAGTTIPDGVKTTVSTATFAAASSSGGLHTNSPVGSLTLLSTGSSDNSTAAAVDLLLNFSGRNAGTLSFDWTQVNNSTGNRAGTVRVYTSTDGSIWTELTAALVSVTNNIAPIASGSRLALALPAALNGSGTARIRFYYHNGTGGSTGSRPKIAIDNLAVTSTGASGTPPAITGLTPASVTTNAGSTVAFTVTSTGDAPAYFWYKETASSTNLIAGATSATLTLANVLAADTANYQVILTNASGMATSEVVSLTVIDPVILSQPASQFALTTGSATFAVTANGTPTLGYQWYQGTLDAHTPYVNSATVAGADTSSLTLSSLSPADATSLFVVVTSSSGSVTSSVVDLTVGNSGSLAVWDFNGNLNPASPVPAQGAGTAALVGLVNGFSNSVATATDYGAQNNAWGSSGYPAQGKSNKLFGFQFNVSTVAAKNIAVSFDARGSATASKYFRLQYTTNGTDFTDYPNSSSLPAVNYYSYTYNLAGFPGVQNNPNFGIRVVSEQESTAKYDATNNANYVGLTSSYATSGTFSLDLVTITAEAILDANAAPTLTGFTNLTTTDLTVATNINFTVADDTTPVGSLTVEAVSDNPAVLSSLSVSGSTASRTLTLSPTVGQIGVAPIRVTVTDANGDKGVAWFYVTVVPGNLPPTLTGLSATNMLGNATNIFLFTVGDDLTPAASLTVSALSGNTTLLPSANITFGGSGASRTLIVAPVTNTYGVAPITVTVNDGEKNTAVNLILTVRPNANIVFNDYFDYDGSGWIGTLSGGLWQTHSGTSGQVQAGAGEMTVSGDYSEDVNAALINAPYYVSNNVVLYSRFTVSFSTAPTEGGNYFAHFKDATTSGFEGRLWASTLNAAGGHYRLGIGNGTGLTNTTAQFPLDLVLNSNYTVVTRLVLTNGFSTIWINPTNEADAQMTDITPVATPLNISTYAFRQSIGIGTMAVSDLTVGTSFNAIMGRATSGLLNIQMSGTNAVIVWNDATFTLQSATNVAGPYVDVSGATSPFTTNAVSNVPAQFFRLYHP